MEHGGGTHTHTYTHTVTHTHTHAQEDTLREDRQRDEYRISILGCGRHSKCVLYLSWVHTLMEGWNPSSQTKKKEEEDATSCPTPFSFRNEPKISPTESGAVHAP